MSDELRKHLSDLLEGEGAHASFADTVKDFPENLRGIKPSGAPHTAWQLLEHLRIALWDMLEFSRDPKHQSPPWPEGYWAKQDSPPGPQAWDHSVSQYESHIRDFQALLSDSERDLLQPYPEGSGKPLLRNVLVIADHNSYHIGQLMYLRRTLGA
ncbi:MAG: DinB family protein [Acidobacteriaceae bacterium]|nr:DinB family protein [Acidobacteriaceae bacterium]